VIRSINLLNIDFQNPPREALAKPKFDLQEGAATISANQRSATPEPGAEQITGAGLSDEDFVRRSAQGGVVLFGGNLVSTGILAIAFILVARLLGPADYGAFALSLVIPNFLLLFVGFGVNAAITRYAAFYVSKGMTDEARSITRNGIVFVLLFGGLLTAACAALASPLAAISLHRPELTPYVQEAALFVLAQTLVQASTAAATGWHQMGATSASNVLRSVLMLGLAPALVLLGFGVPGALSAYILSYLAAGLFLVGVVFVTKLRGVQSRTSFFADVKLMLMYGLPTYAGSVVIGLALTYLLFVLAAVATNTSVGYYQAAVNVTAPIAVLSTSVTLALFPAFASLHGMNGNMAGALKHAVRYVAFLATPLVAFLIASAPSLMVTFYGATYAPAARYLQLLTLSSLPLVVGLTVVPTFLNAVGRTWLNMAAAVAGAAVIVVLAPVLGISAGLGVEGLIMAAVLSNVAVAMVGLIVSARALRMTIDYRSAAMVLAASILALAATYLISLALSPGPVSLVLEFVAFFAIYSTAAPLIHAIELEDVVRLREALRGVKAVGWLAVLMLDYEARLAARTNARG